MNQGLGNPKPTGEENHIIECMVVKENTLKASIKLSSYISRVEDGSCGERVTMLCNHATMFCFRH